MTSTLDPAHLLDQRSDAELISAVRAGDTDAYGTLFERHADSARRLAGQIAGTDGDDLVSEAFAKVLVVLQRGSGPDAAFRPYLLSAVRRLHVDRVRSLARTRPTDEIETLDSGVPFRDTAVEGFESGAAAQAFASLPERWQLVLWHTEVEGAKPADVAPLLGMSPNSVSALAYRAREGLRQAYLAQHAVYDERPSCRWTHQQLGAYVRGGASKRDAGKVEGHLQECRRCTAVYLELVEVNSDLGALIGPVVLGAAAAAYLSGASAGAGVGGALLGGALGRVRDAVVGNAATSAVAGVAASAVVVGGVVTGVSMEQTTPARAALGSPAQLGLPTAGLTATHTAAAEPGDPVTARATPSRAVGEDLVITIPDRPRFTDQPVASPTATLLPTDGPTDAPTDRTDQRDDDRTDQRDDDRDGPSEGPSAEPSRDPSAGPTDRPTEKPTKPEPSVETDGPTVQPSQEPTQQVEQPTEQPSQPVETTQPATPDPSTDPSTDPTVAPSDPPTVVEPPTTPPTVDPTVPEPPSADVALDVRFVTRPEWGFLIRIENLPADAGAELTIRGATRFLPDLGSVDVSCTRGADGPDDDVTCAVAPRPSGPDGGAPPAPEVLVPVLPAIVGIVDFEVSSADVVDPDPSNNIVRFRRS